VEDLFQRFEKENPLCVDIVSRVHQTNRLPPTLFSLSVVLNRLHKQDKAICRFLIRNMVDSAAFRDIYDASAYDGAQTITL
jgi:hypothetical protein